MIISPLSFGAAGDGVTDDTAAIQACIDSASRAQEWVMGRITIDFQGLAYAVTETLHINGHPYTSFLNGMLVADGPGWATTDYFIDAAGTTTRSNMRLEFNLGLRCEKKCRGIDLSNAPRSFLNPEIKNFAEYGLRLGANIWLSRINGLYHEYESGDADFLNTPLRNATGIWIDNTGDVQIDAEIGWTYRQVLCQNSGPVRLGGHWYGSSTSPPGMDSIALEVDADGIVDLRDLYIDTGPIKYKKGQLRITSSCFFFYNSPVTPPALTYYIDMVAVGVDQYHNISIDGVLRTNRDLALARKTEMGGNYWNNVPKGWLETGRADEFSRTDPFVFSVAGNDQQVATFESTRDTSRVRLRDKNSTQVVGIGSNANELELFAGGVRVARVRGPLPNSSSGLPSGTIWKDGSNYLRIVP